MASLQIIDGNRRVFRCDIEPGTVTFGWGADNQLLVVDATTAHPAYRIARTGGGFAVQNLDADGALRLNGRAVHEAELHHADVIEAGTLAAVFCAADEEPPLPPLALDYHPQPPQLTGLQKLTWFLTRLGRARHALVTAFELPDDTGRVDRAGRAVNALLRGARPQNADFGQTLVDLLVFLCWHATARGMLAQAEDWLDVLARECPNAGERMALRWDLANASWRAADMPRFAKQAKALVSDKAATPDKWATLAAGLVGRVYTGVSAASARDVIRSANPGIQGQPQIQAMLAVCECPPAYPSQSDAQKGAQRLKPDAVGGFQVMRADACLALAAAAEWVMDWEKMAAWTIEALRAAPCHRPVLYWLCRARLHVQKGNPAEHIGQPWPDRTPEWSRLRLAVDLHQRPDVRTAEPMAAVLEALQTKQDAPEQKLVVALVERALGGKEPLEAAEIEAAGRVCRAVQVKAGTLPWTEIHIARQEVLLARRYKDAYQRLERKEVADEPGAADWATVARILGGDALTGPSKNSSASLQILAAALDRVAGKPLSRAAGRPQLGELRGDGTLARFPCLSGVVDAVALALQVLDGEFQAGDGVLEACRPNEATEPWVRWLYARTLLLLQQGASLAVEDPRVAWVAECWACNQRQSPAGLSELHARISASLNGWIAASPKERRPLDRMRRFRLANYTLADASLPQFAPRSVLPELGERWDALCSAEFGYEMEFGAARRLLVEGDPEAASRALKEMDSSLSGATGIVAEWWRPLVHYWLGVAQARAGQGVAAETLQSLIGGPLDAEARSQVALLELEAGRTEKAEHWLPQASADLPCVRYARALVFARRGALDLVREQLDSPEGRRTLEGSAYELPARRLMAASLDRLGYEEEADRLRAELLAAHPLDEITVARQSRRRLKLVYEEARAGGPHGEGADSLAIVLAPVRKVGWRRPHDVLRQMLTGSGELLGGLGASIASLSQDRLPAGNWMQVLAQRLLCQGNPQAALDLLTSVDPVGAPERVRRTQAILSAWRLLAQSWSLRLPGADLSAVLIESRERLQRIGSGPADETLEYWRRLVGKSLDIAADPDRTEHLRPWPDFDSQPFCRVPGLWAAEPEVRKQSARALAADLAGNGRFAEKQVLLLKALVAWASGEDDAYLEQYGYLEPVLDELPVGGPQLWVASGLIRFSKKDWRTMLDSELPDCVADLANDDVRLLIGLAYARSAADECVKGDVRNALQSVRRAQDNLGVLIEAGVHSN